MFNFLGTKVLTAKDAAKAFLDGRLKFYDIQKMKKADYYFAMEHPDLCWAKLEKEWYSYHLSNGASVVVFTRR